MYVSPLFTFCHLNNYNHIFKHTKDYALKRLVDFGHIKTRAPAKFSFHEYLSTRLHNPPSLPLINKIAAVFSLFFRLHGEQVQMC